MSVFELNRCQMEELKVRHFMAEHDNVYWEDISQIDSLVSDFTIYEAYGCFDFSEDDFWG